MSVERIERIETGITGLDSLIQGGLMRGGVHMLAGGPGTGKTIFASHFAHNASSKLGEKVVYATFEETAEYLKRNAQQLGMDFTQLEASEKLRILDLDALKGKEINLNTSILMKAASHAKVLVVDSLTAFLVACESPYEQRVFMKTLYRATKNHGLTTLLTVTTSPDGELGLESFLADSVMFLENWLDGHEFKTRFIVLKMRGTDHSRGYHSVIFSPEGLRISKY